ncbi:hypothetical protein ACIODT_40120 [Streptomyces sp. NPDC088251]|uniref:hypothetical protein n=1 Tax=unclassified Streptomyces TaxID=2593676 RepID=UPI0038139E02
MAASLISSTARARRWSVHRWSGRARTGHRKVVYNAMEGFGPDTILLVEDHALCEDGEDRGELMLSFSTSVNPHLLGAFAPPVAGAIRTVLRAA